MALAIDRNARTGLGAAGLALAMVGLGFASVPLYRMFCEATGLNGTVRRAEAEAEAEAAGAPAGPVGRLVNVRFDANVSPKLGWRFKPETPVQRVAVGARDMAFFTATNTSDRPLTGTAAFNVTPNQAGQYFVKVQCFCFTEQTLRPGETMRMPVTFYIDPAMLKDDHAAAVSEITLSYTFFPVDRAGSAG